MCMILCNYITLSYAPFQIHSSQTPRLSLFHTYINMNYVYLYTGENRELNKEARQQLSAIRLSRDKRGTDINFLALVVSSIQFHNVTILT